MGDIYVRYELLKETRGIQITIIDDGVPFDPLKAKEPDTTAAIQERKIGGLGIFLVKTIMDSMHYERTADGYNVLTLTKQIEKLST